MKKENIKPILFSALAVLLVIGILRIKVYYDEKPLREAREGVKKSNEEIAKKFEKIAEEAKKFKEKKDEDVNEYKRKIDEFKTIYKENIPYKLLVENSNKYVGEPMKFKGKIIKIIDGEKDNKLNKLYLSLENNREDIIFVSYSKAVIHNTLSIKEGDNIIAYGYMGELTENKIPNTVATLIEKYSI